MIRCPSCGTLNQDDRQSCSNCGSALEQTTVSCPRCGTPNPVGNLFCDRCNTRLPNSGGIIPSDFPAEANGTTDGSQVKGISLPARSPGEDGSPPEDTQGELPDWLRGLAEESQDGVDEADWLSGLLSESDEGDGLEPLEEEALTFESDALPDWFTEGAAQDEIGTADTVVDTLADLPDWLSETADADIAAEAAAPADLPDWLSSPLGDASSSEDAPAEAELPDWLLGTAGVAAAQESTEPLPTDTTEETPSWYAAVADTLEESETIEGQAPKQDAEPQVFSEAELPDWLTEVPEQTSDVEDEPAAALQPEAELPDWLSAIDEDDAADDIDLPDWLQSTPMEGQAPAETTVPVSLDEELPEVSEAVKLPIDDAADLPGVETTYESPTEPEPADIPDWLTNLAEGTPADAGRAAIFSDSDQAPVESEEQPTEMPNWLDDVAPAADVPADGSGAQAFVQPTDSGIEDAVPISAQEEPGETPEWLLGLEVVETPQSESQPGLFEGDTPARAELPTWLQDLRPQSSPAADGTVDVFGATGDLTGAVIPDWLQALRPTPSVPGETPPPRVSLPTPAEPEGPLQGIPGVLPPLARIDAPAEVKPALEVPVPEPVSAQAQLWQSLLEQPRSAERSVSLAQPRSKATATVARLLVAAVLVASILVVSLFLPEMERLAVVSPELVAPGASPLIQHLDAVEAGDRVIVAIEYNTAYAEEMTQIAAPVLQHLTAQGADLTLVSTLPEGVALGAALAAETTVPQPETTYLAGNANGIAGFLSDPSAADAKHILILASQPERLRWWIEQVQLVNSGATASIPLSIGLSASAGPVAAPFYQTSQVQGWLIGLPDALAYRELRGVEDVAATAQTLDILMMSHWAAAILLIIGLPVSLFIGRKGAR